MEADYKYGFGGIEEVLSGDVDKLDSMDDLKIRAESNVIIIPKIIGVYQFPRPNPESRRDKLHCLFEGIESLIPLSLETERAYPGLICIGYDPTIITPPLIRNFLDEHSRKRIKITEYQDMPDFNDKKVDELYESFDTLFRGLFTEQPAIIERTFNVFNKIREEYGLTKSEYNTYIVAEGLCDPNFRKEMKEPLTAISERLGINIFN